MLNPIIQLFPPRQQQRLRHWRQRLLHPGWPMLLRRTVPLSTEWGFDRGTPIDRYYIEQFLAAHQQDIRGHVLEVKDNTYAVRYGSKVEHSDVLDIDPSNPAATIIADLSAADAVGANQFDCFILTQTLQLIYDVHAVVAHAHRILRPGGVLLVTVPCVSRIVPRYGLQTDYWRFTTASCRRLFAESFGAKQITVLSVGNVLSGMAFLNGMASEELSRCKLELHDDYFPVIITVRAIKQD